MRPVPARRALLLPVLATVLAAASLVASGSAGARTFPLSGQFRVVVVDRIPDGAWASLARRGAVGLMRPGVGPTTNRRRALAELVRGAEVNARLGGVPPGPPLIGVARMDRVPTGHPVIVVTLPPRGSPASNDRLYRVAIVGMGYHGLLTSPTTRIPGLISIVDIAPTVLRHVRGGISWTPSSGSVARLAALQRQIGSNNRLKFPALFIVAGLLLLFALLGLRAAATAVPAALLVNLGLGVAAVSNEVLLCAAIAAGTALLALWLQRACRGDGTLLALCTAVVGVYGLVMVVRPEWQAVNPLGPTQNSRFWGIGNQVETLLLAPLLTGALLARRRLGVVGFVAFSVLGLVVMTDNRFGSDGGGAITLGVALAILGTRLFRLGPGGFLTLLAAAATGVLWIVSRNLGRPGPDHLRSALGNGGSGLLHSLASRVPLAYEPALHHWPLVLPLLLLLVAAYALAFRAARVRERRDLLLAFGAAIVTSLLLNDSAGYELAAGIAVVAAVGRFTPAPAPERAGVLGRLLARAAPQLGAEPAGHKPEPS